MIKDEHKIQKLQNHKKSKIYLFFLKIIWNLVVVKKGWIDLQCCFINSLQAQKVTSTMRIIFCWKTWKICKLKNVGHSKICFEYIRACHQVGAYIHHDGFVSNPWKTKQSLKYISFWELEAETGCVGKLNKKYRIKKKNFETIFFVRTFI